MSQPDPKKFRLNMFLPLITLALIAVFVTYVVRNNYMERKNTPVENRTHKVTETSDGETHAVTDDSHEKADSSHHH